MGPQYSRHANSSQILWRADAAEAMDCLPAHCRAEVDDVLDCVVAVERAVFKELPTTCPFKITDDLLAKIPGMGVFKSKDYSFFNVRLSRSTFGTLLIQAETVDIHLTIASEISVSRVERHGGSPGGGGKPRPTPTKPWWHNLLPTEPGPTGTREPCHAGARVLDDAVSMFEDDASIARDILACALRGLWERLRFWLRSALEFVGVLTPVAATARHVLRHKVSRVEGVLVYSARTLLTTTRVDGPCIDFPLGKIWDVRHGVSTRIVRVEPTSSWSNRSYALLPDGGNHSPSEIFLSVPFKHDTDGDDLYLLLCGALAKIRHDFSAPQICRVYVHCVDSAASGGHDTTGMLANLRRTFPMRMRFRGARSHASLFPGLLEFSCHRLTSELLADYYDEACRRVDLGECLADAFIPDELRTAILRMRVREELDIFWSVFSPTEVAGKMPSVAPSA